MNEIILPQNSALRQIISDAVATKKALFFVGLPGTGKSLLLQQAACLALEAGREVHLLQWDVVRAPFDSAENLAKYPERDGETDPFIRKAVGIWARAAIERWVVANETDESILLGELPLLGNRLIEVVQKRTDSAENFLASTDCHFLIPVPSREIRDAIEAARAKTIANPRNQNETKDAPPNIVEAHWREMIEMIDLYSLGERDSADYSYNPILYADAYSYLLRHRNYTKIAITELLKPVGSVYDIVGITAELAASEKEARQLSRDLEQQMSYEEIVASVARWHQI